MRFRIRDFEPGEMIAREPNMRVLEITRNWDSKLSHTDVYLLTAEDVAAINALAFAINSHEPLPIEAGEA
jgi:hypothetical protein